MKNLLKNRLYFFTLLLLLFCFQPLCSSANPIFSKNNCSIYLKKAEQIEQNKNISSVDKQLREWYLLQDQSINNLVPAWDAKGLSKKEQAYQAWRIRHQARIKARLLMPNIVEVNLLRARDKCVYGDPNGPSFAQEVSNAEVSGLKGDAIYEHIIFSAQKTNSNINKYFGLQHTSS